MYIDKIDRLVGIIKIDFYLDLVEEGKYKVLDEVKVIVYDICENGILNVVIDGKYRGLILVNEYFDYIYLG